MMAVLIEASVRMAFVGCGVGLALLLTRVGAAGARHAAWTAVMAAMLGSPLWVAWAPRLPATVPRVPALESIVPSLDGGAPAAAPDTAPTPASVPRTAPATRSSLDMTAPPVARRSSVEIVSSAWLAGMLILLARGAIGWRLARRLVIQSRPVEASSFPVLPCAPVAESGHVAAPVVVGVWHQRIILPASWRGWPEAHLEAALVHESAHVRRRDTLVSFLARLNCCLFWFHPLAWYLERAIAQAAEQVCDEAVVRRTRRSESYAALLVTMAETIRARGGLVRWQAVGMAGRGRLEARIDRVLSVEGLQPPARARLAALAVICGVMIAAGIACRQQPAPLRPNAEYMAQREAGRDQTRHLLQALEMTPEQFEALEARATANPDDLDAVEAVLHYYDRRGQDVFGWNEMVARRRPHLLRVIELHPEAMVARRTFVRRYDPEGYEAAKALWLAHVERPEVPAAVLGNAAEFFRAFEKPRAAALLARARALDPDGPPAGPAGVFRFPWTMQLGWLYAQAIVGADDQTPLNVVRSISVDQARGAFAQSVRRTLQETTDASLLFWASQYLMVNVGAAAEVLDFDPVTLGRDYLDRALELDPGSARALALRAWDAARIRYAGMQALLNDAQADPAAAFGALTERDRFDLAAEAARRLYMIAEGVHADDPVRMRVALDAASLFAEGALAISDRFRSDPHFGTVVYDANIVLGQLALRDGDRRRAVEYLSAAAESPGSPELEYGPLGPPRLASYLLSEGERESIIAFYERLAELNPAGRDRWLADAAAIRAGEMTTSYHAVYGTDGD